MEQDSNVNLKWDAHQTTLKSVFDTLLDTESLADCTIGAEGQHIKAHKLMLSACSRYFELLFGHHCGKHIIVILPGVQFHILKALMEFIYRGEVLIPQDKIDTLLQLADFLQVKGLSRGGNVLSERKQTYKSRNKSPTTRCRASPDSYKHRDSPELLEVSGSSSQSECLQKQDYTNITPVSSPALKCKKNDHHSSRKESPPQEDLVPPLHTASCNFPFQRSDLPGKSNYAHGMFSDQVSRPSLTSKLPVFSGGNFTDLTMSREKLNSAKPLNSVVRTSVCPTVTTDNTILETFTDPKRESCSGLNEDHVHDVMLDGDDIQCENITDDNSELTKSSFCDEDSLTQQVHFQQAEWSNMDPTEQISASNYRFKCQSCNRSYRHQGDLARHLKYECGKDPQFQCPQCLKRFRHKHHLKVHMIRHNH